MKTLLDDDALGQYCKIELDTTIYPVDVVMKTAYWFTDRCYLYIDRKTEVRLQVEIRQKNKAERQDLRNMAREFCNGLIDFRVRRQILEETKSVRETLLGAALREAQPLDSE